MPGHCLTVPPQLNPRSTPRGAVVIRSTQGVLLGGERAGPPRKTGTNAFDGIGDRKTSIHKRFRGAFVSTCSALFHWRTGSGWERRYKHTLQ